MGDISAEAWGVFIAILLSVSGFTISLVKFFINLTSRVDLLEKEVSYNKSCLDENTKKDQDDIESIKVSIKEVSTEIKTDFKDILKEMSTQHERIFKEIKFVESKFDVQIDNLNKRVGKISDNVIVLESKLNSA